MKLGFGEGHVTLPEGTTSISEFVGGTVLGPGYDVRVAPGCRLTPYANGIGYPIDGEGWDVFQFGLGVTWH